jgi:hypothetical protein
MGVRKSDFAVKRNFSGIKHVNAQDRQTEEVSDEK